MKVMLVGDVHASEEFALSVVKAARSGGTSTIIALGDFGFLFTDDFIRVWTEWLDEDDENVLYWIDGNHDNHDLIKYQITDDRDTAHPIAHWHDRMLYCPRGSTAVIGGARCLFLGGSHSIDAEARTPGKTWWWGERITERDASVAASRGKVDVMFTHDCPETAWFVGELERGHYKVDSLCQEQRSLITDVVRACDPARLFHGHYHYAYSTDYEGRCVVTGLADNTAYRDRAVFSGNVKLIDL